MQSNNIIGINKKSLKYIRQFFIQDKFDIQ